MNGPLEGNAQVPARSRTSGRRAGLALGAVLALAVAGAPGASAQEGDCVEDLQIFTEHDAGRVTISWTAVPGASSYDVHRELDGGPSEHVATLPATELSFLDDPAPEGVLDYRVGVNGHPADTCPSVATHIGGQDPGPPDDEGTCATGVTAIALPDRSIQVSWDAVPGATLYRLSIVVEGEPFPRSFEVAGTTTTFVDTDLALGVLHTYRVAADGDPTDDCPAAEATAIPFFQGLAGLALAGVGLAVAVAWRRRA